jgi:hypothetical protein
VAHLPLVAHLCLAHLAGDVVYVDAFSLALHLTAVWSSPYELFAERAEVLLRDIGLLIGLGLLIFLGFLELSSVL